MPFQNLTSRLILYFPPILHSRELNLVFSNIHAVNMEEPKNREEEEKNPIILFLSNFLAAIKLPFLQKNGAESESAVAITQAEELVKINPDLAEDESNTRNVVAFPRQNFAPLKLEAEADEGERSTNPVLLWQVYAIGGILVLRWAWTKWNERKGKKKSDDEPPPARD